jgi:YVTN family beta-propeller protein
VLHGAVRLRGLALPALLAAALLTACGGSAKRHAAHTERAARTVAPQPRRSAAVAAPAPRALVTDETENRLLVVALPSGRVLRRVAVPADPEDLATERGGGDVVVVSSAAGEVTLLSGDSLRRLKVLAGFETPHIATITPDGKHAYVTDDRRGTVSAIDLTNLRVTSAVEVGAGAHHLSFEPNQQVAWVALGESARTIVVLRTTDVEHPDAIARFDPGFAVHDLSFSPDGQRVWVTAASGPDVAVFGATDRRLRFRVPVGPPPQHVALDGRYAYLTSGYGSTIEKVDGVSGRILARASAPYGSFELAVGGGYVVTSSLLRGTLAIYTPQLKLVRVAHLAPATREVAISSPA